MPRTLAPRSDSTASWKEGCFTRPPKSRLPLLRTNPAAWGTEETAPGIERNSMQGFQLPRHAQTSVCASTPLISCRLLTSTSCEWGCTKPSRVVIPENQEEMLTRDLETGRHRQTSRLLYGRHTMQESYFYELLLDYYSVSNNLASGRLTAQTSASSSFLLLPRPSSHPPPQLSHLGLFPSVQSQPPPTFNSVAAAIEN